VRAAGALARGFFGTALDIRSKGAAGPVTNADMAADALLREMLMGARPDYGWLSEESSDDGARLSRPRTWIVDPIDGTQSFIAGESRWVISVGLAEYGAVRAGAIFNPMTDELWSGAVGAGAWRNGAPITVNPRSALAGARVIGRKGFYADAKRWAEPWPVLDYHFRPAIAERLALIAAGEGDAIVLPAFKHEWDVCGGAGVLAGAGAVVTDLWGETLVFNQPDARLAGVVAAGPALHPLLIDRTRRLADPRAHKEQRS